LLSSSLMVGSCGWPRAGYESYHWPPFENGYFCLHSIVFVFLQRRRNSLPSIWCWF